MSSTNDNHPQKDDLIVITGAGGFIAGSLARYFHDRGFTRIRAVDKKPLPDWYQRVPGVECLCLDVSEEENCRRVCEGAVEVYNLAADMGGMGFIERFRIECLRSILINTHMIEAAYRAGAERYFYSSSACAYNTDLQKDPNVRALKESDAYPAMAERGYGWEKLMSEMFCQEYWAERGMKTAIARFHNVYGPNGTWDGGREKAPAAICRKVIEAKDNEHRLHRDLGRRHADPQLHVHRRLHPGHRPDHALRGADRHARSTSARASWSRSTSWSSMAEEIGGVKLAAQLQARRAQGRGRPQQRQHDDPAHPGLGAEHAVPRRAGQDLRLDRAAVRRTARPASARSATRSETADRHEVAQQSPTSTDVIGAIPYRMAFAGGWIDQPFVSRLNPTPPGSMVVVGLEPTFRFMDRAGMATGTRNVALRLWNGRLPDRDPAELVRELYAAENRGKPSRPARRT